MYELYELNSIFAAEKNIRKRIFDLIEKDMAEAIHDDEKIIEQSSGYKYRWLFIFHCNNNNTDFIWLMQNLYMK